MALLPGLERNVSARTLARNAAIPMAAGIVAKALDSLFALLYFRVLGTEGTAALQYLVVLITYLDTLVNFGLNALLARDTARSPEAAWPAFRAVGLLRGGLWLLGLPLVAVAVGPARVASGFGPGIETAGWLFYVGLLPSILASGATGLLWGIERLHVPALVSVASTVLKIALGALALLAAQGVTGLAATSLVVNLFAAGTLVWLAARALPPGRPLSKGAPPDEVGAQGVRVYLRESWPLFINQLLAGLFFKVDSLLLPRLAGATAAGSYAAAYKVIDGVGVISSSVTLALFPRLARDASAERERLARAYRLALRFLLQLAFPLAAVVSLLAEPIVALVAGPAFLPDGALALSLLIWFLPFSFFNGLTQYVLIALGRQRSLTAAFLVAFAFNLAGNLLLLPRFGIVAAAAVTILSEVVLLVPFAWIAIRALPGTLPLRDTWNAGLATLLMAPLVWWLRDSLHPLAAAPAGILAYLVALWAFGGIDHEQRQIVASVLRRRESTADAPA